MDFQAGEPAMRGVLIDLDGVIWENDQVVHGAAETVDWLNTHDIPYLFVTNTTSRPVRLIANKLMRLGIQTPIEKILTPPIAATVWLEGHAPGPTTLLVPDATKEDFVGIQSVGLTEATDLAAVVVGDMGEAWNFALLNDVFRHLMNERPPQLIALGMTRYWHGKDGLQLDVAPFIKALEYAAGCEAIVLGKPSTDFFAVALAMINCAAIETIMIGDDLIGDVLGAQEAGIQGILTKTGKFRPQDMDTGIMPDGLLDSIAELPAWLSQ
jgi:phospholysine phosphohistidine inorganic pyrophosphate phosphatase